MRGWGTLVFGALLAALVVTLVVRNGQTVVVDLLVTTWPTKVWGAMVASAVLGAAASSLLLVWPVARAKMQSRRQVKRIAELEQEIHGLRTLPIARDATSAASEPKV
jgi:uncharacterized integral membrane protein